jgi:glycosyltransferase involved in cell wall biosynthesis
MMKVVQLTPHSSRLGGGMFGSIRQLSQTLEMNQTIRVCVVALSDSKTAEDLSAWAPIDVRLHSPRYLRSFGFAPAINESLFASNADLTHVHGLWTYLSIAVHKWSRRINKPYIVSPRGMLDPWALKRSAVKKQIARLAFQNRCMARAKCIHATSDMEAKSIRAAGFANPIAVIPNGVEIPVDLVARNNDESRTRSALFLSRIHPKKGALNLIEAWNIARPERWELRIVGPDENNHRAELEHAVRRFGLSDSVTFHGAVTGAAKRNFYEAADLFVLPSFSENFGNAIAEALSFGVPVITTRATPWQELETSQCGWWIDTGTGALINTLRDATARPLAQLHAMGLRGRDVVARNYSWDRVARDIAKVYTWVVGGAAAPSTVHF